MKKFTAFLLALLLIVPGTGVRAFTDEYIEKDVAMNTYAGRLEAAAMQLNLNFSDMADYGWAMESVARNSALDLIKGFEQNFYPDRLVTKGEAIAHIMRALGFEREALLQAGGLSVQLPPGVATDTLVELAYLDLASGEDIISRQDFTDAMYEEEQRQLIRNAEGDAAAEAFVLPDIMFERNAAATREEVAYWIYAALLTVEDTLWENPESVQSLYLFEDWADINPSYLLAAEAMLANNIMAGNMGRFSPKEGLSRAALSQIMRNMNDIYYIIMGIQKKSGVVAGLLDGVGLATTDYSVARTIMIRTDDGEKDVFEYSASVNPAGQIESYDAVVFRGGAVSGLPSLEEGDVVEYLADGGTDTVLYVEVLGAAQPLEIQGVLDAVDFLTNSITLREIDGNPHTYTFVRGMAYIENNVDYLIMEGLALDSRPVAASGLPIGSMVSILLVGNIAIECRYIGEPVIVSEGGGVVLENDPAFGYLTILDHSGVVVPKRYYENEMEVQKREYYDTSEGVGYIAQVFPYFGYNPRTSTISNIEPGDLVFYRTDPEQPEVITTISAVTNYTMRHGKVLSIVSESDYTEIMVEYENHATAWFSVANQIYVMKDGRPSSMYNLHVGDWVKLLVNEAIIAPGRVSETVKELLIEGPERYISQIVKGNLSDVDPVQFKLYVSNAQTLAKTGWTDYNNISGFDLSGSDIEYYDNGTRISKDDAIKRFRRSDATVYVGLENSYLGDRVKVVSFRESRDMVLDPDTVVSASGAGYFELLSQPGGIATDDGTIVVRNGRLVGGRDVYPSDYARVVMNGAGRAAVVDISDMPDTSLLMFARGRVLSIDEGNSFSVRGMSVLRGTDWNYTPVERVFEIDYNTIFLNEAGYVDPATFIPYTEDTALENYYYIVGDGSRAAFVVEAPFCIGAVRGTVYEASDSVVSIKDAMYLDNATGIWSAVSNTNNTLQINIHENTLIGKNKAIVTSSDLSIGDGLLVMIEDLDDESITPDTEEINGYIIRVEN
ncbi:MAG: S-layer homology domain-containing protein [Clostridiales bacterium]|jgi:hypothetical protein|nr:S-layer homology domain-containing protein [Clostridiales bacterium]